jgi:hypothetical protein
MGDGSVWLAALQRAAWAWERDEIRLHENHESD